MQTFKLYITDKMGIFEEPLKGKRFTRRKPYFTDRDRSEWRVELYMEVGVNLTDRKLAYITPNVMWWIKNEINASPYAVYFVDPRPVRKIHGHRLPKGQMELGI